MPKVRVDNFSVSIDGYGAGPDQDLDNPLGAGGARLHEWLLNLRDFRRTFGMEGGDEGIDNDHLVKGNAGVGATIIGRNMFGPIRGPWGDEEWHGWWGDEPPYHCDVFVLTHYVQNPIEMKGGTTFHFVDAGIEAALEQAFAAAAGQDVRLGGGVSTIQQYLRAGLVDEMHVAIAPVLLGAGERLFDGLGDLPGYECAEVAGSPRAAHFRLVRSRAG
jgi:dihydrofolate reductase